jgi:hypothetical protein
MTPLSGNANAALVQCGKLRFIVYRQRGIEELDALDAHGKLRSKMHRVSRLEGALLAGVPHGIWVTIDTDTGETVAWLEYRRGELVDFRWQRRRDISVLNWIRGARGLPELAEHDFPEEGAPEER